MSKNYIKVLLEPFRESKVFGQLVKLFSPVASGSSKDVKSGKEKVNIFFRRVFCVEVKVM